MKVVLQLVPWIYLVLCLTWLTSANMDGFSYDDVKDLSKIADVSEVCSRMLDFMNISECEEAIEGPAETEDGKTVVSQGSKIALFDACNPREQTVALPRDPDPRITVWPICTRVRRCGGCCTSDVFTCSPTVIKDKHVKVFRTLLPYPGAHMFRFLGVRVVKLEEHTQCDAQCKIKEHECHKYQVYERRKCRCKCRHERMVLKDTCTDEQVWDDNECSCVCPGRNTVFCPAPSVFSEATCKCTLKTSVTGEIDLEKLFEQIDQGLWANFGGLQRPGIDANIGINDTDEVYPEGDGLGDVDEIETTEESTTRTTPTTTSTTTTTTPTTTTTTPTTTTPKPTPKPKPKAKCPKRCPPSWKPTYVSNSKCLCMPASRRRGWN